MAIQSTSSKYKDLIKSSDGDSRQKIMDDICYLIGYIQWDDEDEPLRFLMQNYTTLDLSMIRNLLRAKQ